MIGWATNIADWGQLKGGLQFRPTNLLTPRYGFDVMTMSQCLTGTIRTKE
jgi:hypothetical protein